MSPTAKCGPIFSTIRIGSLYTISCLLANTYAVVLVPIANSPSGKVSWSYNTFALKSSLFLASSSKLVHVKSLTNPSSNHTVRLLNLISLRYTLLTLSTPVVFLSTGDVNTSPSGILTSARQFSNTVCVLWSVIFIIETFMSVQFPLAPLTSTYCAVSSTSISACWIALYLL